MADEAREVSQFNYEAKRDQALDWSRCFLCGVSLNDENRTDEHVFPRWMLRRFDLFGEVLNLFNGTGIRYSVLKIPCCSTCNNVWLSQIEDQIAEATANGREAVERLSPQLVAIWMTKIFYGLLFRNLALASDQKDPESESLMTPEVLKEFAELHQILQVTRGEVVIPSDRSPASIFVFDTLDSEIPKAGFDYIDLTVPPFLSIRLGEVGIAAGLLDWGAAKTVHHSHLEPAFQVSLHPMQFREVSAYLASVHARLNRTPKYLIGASDDGPDQMMVMPMMGMSSKPPFDDFDPRFYAHFWAKLSGFEIDQIWDQEGDRHWTTLHVNGEPFQAKDIEETHFRPPEWS